MVHSAPPRLMGLLLQFEIKISLNLSGYLSLKGWIGGPELLGGSERRPVELLTTPPLIPQKRPLAYRCQNVRSDLQRIGSPTIGVLLHPTWKLKKLSFMFGNTRDIIYKRGMQELERERGGDGWKLTHCFAGNLPLWKDPSHLRSFPEINKIHGYNPTHPPYPRHPSFRAKINTPFIALPFVVCVLNTKLFWL